MITAITNGITPQQSIKSARQISMTGNFLKTPKKTQEVFATSTKIIESIIKKAKRLFNESIDSILLNKLHIYDSNNNIEEIHTYNYEVNYKGKTGKYLLKEFLKGKKGTIGHEGRIYSQEDGSFVSMKWMLSKKEQKELNQRYRMNTNFMKDGW